MQQTEIGAFQSKTKALTHLIFWLLYFSTLENSMEKMMAQTAVVKLSFIPCQTISSENITMQVLHGRKLGCEA
jgi:hypothetical protein